MDKEKEPLLSPEFKRTALKVFGWFAVGLLGLKGVEIAASKAAEIPSLISKAGLASTA